MVPYSTEHKQETRAKIIEAARVLFNRHGFDAVTIDQIMQSAGLTRGGFYNHFESKELLYSEAVSSFLMGAGAKWRAKADVDPHHPTPGMALRMLESYLSKEHLGDIDGQCPMIALPSDVARASSSVQESYQKLLEAMIWLFEQDLDDGLNNSKKEKRQKAMSLAALAIGGMILARTMPDCSLANEVRNAAFATASSLTSHNQGL